MQQPKTINETWLDKGRNREIPVKIYLPENAAKPPVLIFSHGLGGTCESYQYIGQFLARHGIVAIHPTHYGIDASLMTGERPFKNLKEAADNPENLRNLPEDIHFIMDYIEYKAMPFDFSRIAVGGHSFGSYTALAVCGQDVSRDGTEIDYGDERVTCAVVISPLATRREPAKAYEEIIVPILHITGKKDDSPFGLLEPAERRIPYDNMNHSDQYLVIFDHADHMVFAAQRRGNKFSAEDVKVMELTAQVMLEFFKKYLLKENSALDSDELYATLTAHGSFEKKLRNKELK
jgi:predicted dienelactone hydrolase